MSADSIGSGALEDQPTVMTMIQGAVELSPIVRRTKFDRLIRYYRPPLIHYLTSRFRLPIYEADDLVQTFLMKKLLEPAPEDNLVASYLKVIGVQAGTEGIPASGDSVESGGGRGRFRAYLRTALKFYVYDYFRRTSRRRELAVIDEATEQHTAVSDSAADLDYDQTWARNLLRMVIESVRRDCEEQSQEDIWYVLNERLLKPLQSGEPARSFEELCSDGMFPTAIVASNRFESAKRKLRAALRHHVLQYLPGRIQTSELINEELNHLRDILLSSTNSVDDHGKTTEIESVNSIFLSDAGQDVASDSDERRIADMSTGWRSLLLKPLSEAISGVFDSPAAIPVCPDFLTNLSLADVLHGERPPLQALRFLKDAAKLAVFQQRHHRDQDGRVAFGRVIYVTSIAAAALRHQVAISSQVDAESAKRFSEIMQFEWLDRATRVVLRKWLDSIPGN